MNSAPYSITDLPDDPAIEARSRMRQYTIMMLVRVACMGIAILLAAVAPGWWILLPILGAVFLPFFAVVLANAPVSRRGAIERPGRRALTAAPATHTPPAS